MTSTDEVGGGTSTHEVDDDNVVFPSNILESSEDIDGVGEAHEDATSKAEEFYRSKGCSKKVLLAMTVGMGIEGMDNGRFNIPPYNNLGRSAFIPSREFLSDEVLRRVGIQKHRKRPRPRNWTLPQMYKWLAENPITEDPDVNFIKREEGKFRQGLIDEEKERLAEKERWTEEKIAQKEKVAEKDRLDNQVLANEFCAGLETDPDCSESERSKRRRSNELEGREMEMKRFFLDTSKHLVKERKEERRGALKDYERIKKTTTLDAATTLHRTKMDKLKYLDQKYIEVEKSMLHCMELEGTAPNESLQKAYGNRRKNREMELSRLENEIERVRDEVEDAERSLSEAFNDIKDNL